MPIVRQRSRETFDDHASRGGLGQHPTPASVPRVPGWPAPALAGAWIAVMGAIYVLEPATNPTASVGRWAELLMLAFNLALMGAVVGLIWRRRWSFGASGVASVLGMGVAVACAVTDHHLGVYWAYELTGFTALGLATGLARLHAA
ncbi:MAG: hypothetical protein ACRDJF_09950 [Actinomycetota bacterium]